MPATEVAPHAHEHVLERSFFHEEWVCVLCGTVILCEAMPRE